MCSDGDKMTGTAERLCEIERSGCTYRVHNRDCIDGMDQVLEPESVDVVVTSPPYNLGTGYKKYDDTIARDDYLSFMGSWGKAVKRVLKPDGSVFLNMSGKPSDPWGPFEVLFELRTHFEVQNIIHWIKSVAIQKEDVGKYPGITGNVSVGHYKPINSQRYLNDCHEYIFHLSKTGDVALDRLAIGVEYQDKSNVKRWHGARSDLRCRGNTWFVPYKTIQSRDRERPHPATFPVKIPEMCIRLHGLDKEPLVMDPFLGIGNTARACLQLEVDFVGFEIDESYCRESMQVLEDSTPEGVG